MPLVDKEIHFLQDGSQRLIGNVKITNLQHQYAKGHLFLPFHADLLEVAVVASLLIAQVYPAEAAALKQPIESVLTPEQQPQASKFFIAKISMQESQAFQAASWQQRYVQPCKPELVP